MKPSDIRELYRYNRAVLEAYEGALGKLSWRTLNRDRGTGHLTLKRTFVHILNVHDAWLNYIARGQTDRLDAEWPQRDGRRMQSWSEVRAYSRRVWKGVDDLLRGLTAAQLRRRVQAPWMPGRYTLEDAFLQATFEQAHHLGELISIYWRMNREPPMMVWIRTMAAVKNRRAGRGAR